MYIELQIKMDTQKYNMQNKKIKYKYTQHDSKVIIYTNNNDNKNKDNT